MGTLFPNSVTFLAVPVPSLDNPYYLLFACFACLLLSLWGAIVLSAMSALAMSLTPSACLCPSISASPWVPPAVLPC
jgi:hypothetical protein